MGKLIDEDDELPELEDTPEVSEGNDEEALGIEDAEELTLAEIEDGPEEIGLDTETLESADAFEGALDEELENGLVGDDAPLELGNDLEDEGEEDGWTEESEGSGGAWDDDTLDDELAEEDEELDEDGGLEGLEELEELEDSALDDDFAAEGETSFPMDGDDRGADDELERVELDLG